MKANKEGKLECKLQCKLTPNQVKKLLKVIIDDADQESIDEHAKNACGDNPHGNEGDDSCES